MITYKGTDKDMKCLGGFQYELGKTVERDGAVRCGDKGFHSCEAPLDVLRYFPVTGENRYFYTEADGKIDRTGADDSKLASSRLTLKAEIGLPGLAKAQVEYVKELCRDSSTNTASGERGNAAASGVSGNAAASGWRGNAAAFGVRGNAAASGWSGNAAASGVSGNAAASGWRGNAAASGVRGVAASSGWYGSAEALGHQCIAVAWGRDGKARGSIGSWIVLNECGDESNEILDAVLIKVDGDAIKENTWYILRDGKVLEADDE